MCGWTYPVRDSEREMSLRESEREAMPAAGQVLLPRGGPDELAACAAAQPDRRSPGCPLRGRQSSRARQLRLGHGIRAALIQPRTPSSTRSRRSSATCSPATTARCSPSARAGQTKHAGSPSVVSAPHRARPAQAVDVRGGVVMRSVVRLEQGGRRWRGVGLPELGSVIAYVVDAAARSLGPHARGRQRVEQRHGRRGASRGSSHAASSPRSSMITGMRSWTGAISSFAAVVKIAHPVRDRTPAKANTELSFTP